MQEPNIQRSPMYTPSKPPSRASLWSSFKAESGFSLELNGRCLRAHESLDEILTSPCIIELLFSSKSPTFKDPPWGDHHLYGNSSIEACPAQASWGSPSAMLTPMLNSESRSDCYIRATAENFLGGAGEAEIDQMPPSNEVVSRSRRIQRSGK